MSREVYVTTVKDLLMLIWLKRFLTRNKQQGWVIHMDLLAIDTVDLFEVRILTDAERQTSLKNATLFSPAARTRRKHSRSMARQADAAERRIMATLSLHPRGGESVKNLGLMIRLRESTMFLKKVIGGCNQELTSLSCRARTTSRRLGPSPSASCAAASQSSGTESGSARMYRFDPNVRSRVDNMRRGLHPITGLSLMSE